MADSSATFRIATQEDWPAIWPIFREVVAAGDTYMFSPGITEEEARAAWMLCDLEERRSVTFIACLGNASQIVGTAIVKPNALGLGDHIANAAWMISAAARGKGVGKAFARYVIEHAKSLGYTGMQFNAVVATNEPAIALWRRLGFEIVGTVPRAFRHATAGLVAIHIMYRDLV